MNNRTLLFEGSNPSPVAKNRTMDKICAVCGCKFSLHNQRNQRCPEYADTVFTSLRPNNMEYKDGLRLRLIQAGIEPTEDIIRFIELETIPLKAELFIKRGDIIEWDETRGLFNEHAKATNVIGYFEANGYKLIK